ncbi:class I SAM-dependent methyltransferase [Pseudochryseolinea flava]|uniref:Class I SAM-dependent methyltransferase n=1 Tax=Pseudochryseolinea flava TaxID=2059302 RepID=A0A364Y5B1_9BACT|nr:class I SAM-dependent methyltransferase [Pseudochryseolinea flava]RAW02186.1 class I SAM-dependent methyltransferase [Pseudochryseolinea flava]
MISAATSRSSWFYDRLTFLYPVVDIFLKPQKQKLFEEINKYAPGQLLEIGVGNGTHLKYYTQHQVIGIDSAQNMLAKAEKHLKPNIQLHHMNGEALQFPDLHFDYIVLSHVIAVVDDPDKLLHEAHRVLKPNGKLFILNHVTPNNWVRFIDKSFERISKFAFFKSVFHLSDLTAIKRFNLIHDINAGFFSYFKIMIYEKAL